MIFFVKYSYFSFDTYFILEIGKLEYQKKIFMRNRTAVLFHHRNRDKYVQPGEIFTSFFLYFRIFAIFPKYMKNKIGILENDIYIFPIVNSLSLLVHIVWAVFAPYLGAFEGIAYSTTYDLSTYQMAYFILEREISIYQKIFRSFLQNRPATVPP